MEPFSARLFCFLIFSLLAIRPTVGQGSDPTGGSTRILALEHAWNQAETAQDLKSLDLLFDNALIYIDYDGTLLTKAEFLARVRLAPRQQVVTESMTVQMFGSTAIVTGTYRCRDLSRGKATSRHGRFVDTWIFKNSVWVCLAAQSTPILR